MGRDAKGRASLRGQSGNVTAHLESDALILRGELRLRLPRSDLSGWRADGDDLHLLAGDLALTLTLGANEAAAWVRALDRPLPTLTEKLGISASARPWLTGALVPDALTAALVGQRAHSLSEAAMLIALLDAPDDTLAALHCGQAAGLPVWCLYRKGRGDGPRDATVRAAFRAAGWKDVKACAVDEVWTATRYVPPGA